MSLDMATLAAQYGFSAAFFGSDPELTRLIKDATNGQWSTQKFQAKFMATQWYRARDASVRQWMDLQTRDPATARQKISDKKIELSDNLTQLGIAPDDATLTSLATNALQYTWTSQQTKDVLSSMVNFHAPLQGTPRAIQMQISSMANDYGMKPTDAQLADWTSGMLSDKYTEDNLKSVMTDFAKSKYPGMNTYLDMGMSVKQVAQPYLQSYANLLEVNPDTINLNDGLIQQALQGQPPQPNQPPTMQSVYQFEKSLRKDPRWATTKNARDAVTSAGQSVLKDWGLVG